MLCDKNVSARVKGKVNKTVVRPALLYGAETWALKNGQEKKLGVTEMRMLKGDVWSDEGDRIRNDRIRGTVKVVEASMKAQERRLQWFGHVKRREEDYVGMRVMEDVQGRRRRGRPKLRWKDRMREDLREGQLGEEPVMDIRVAKTSEEMRPHMKIGNANRGRYREIDSREMEYINH